jgi:hypothetical protein
LTRFCVQLLPADAAGIVLGDARWELRAVAASDDAAHVMELLQLQSDECPCLDCFQSGAPVTVTDLTEAADRWPAFVAALAWRTDFAPCTHCRCGCGGGRSAHSICSLARRSTS